MKKTGHLRILLSFLMLLQFFIAGAAVVVVYRAEQLEAPSSNSANRLLQRLNESGRNSDIGLEQALKLLHLSLKSEVMLDRAFKALVRVQLAFGVLSLVTAAGVAYVLWMSKRAEPGTDPGGIGDDPVQGKRKENGPGSH